VLMKSFDGRKTNKGRQSEECCKARELSHGTSITVQPHGCQWFPS
jgi:hypothetical protein